MPHLTCCQTTAGPYRLAAAATSAAAAGTSCLDRSHTLVAWATCLEVPSTTGMVLGQCCVLLRMARELLEHGWERCKANHLSRALVAIAIPTTIPTLHVSKCSAQRI